MALHFEYLALKRVDRYRAKVPRHGLLFLSRSGANEIDKHFY
jgi:hypothetical protein